MFISIIQIKYLEDIPVTKMMSLVNVNKIYIENRLYFHYSISHRTSLCIYLSVHLSLTFDSELLRSMHSKGLGIILLYVQGGTTTYISKSDSIYSISTRFTLETQIPYTVDNICHTYKVNSLQISCNTVRKYSLYPQL